MCGIAGRRGLESEADVREMLDGIRHRGPDEGGQWTGAGWSIGMRRLAIMDPAHGRQPMVTPDGRWALVFNGEIYNFRRLATGLAAAGVALHTRTDTEVLLHLIARDGVLSALARIEGMFAFAAVETSTGDLWLARDRFGEKPLYLDRRGAGLAFCSELWPLIAARCAPPARIDARGTMSLLRFGEPWPGTTAVAGVGELRPGEWVRIAGGRVESSGRYWSPPDRIDESQSSPERSGERLLQLLDESVRDRLVADVPLGLFLSGGIDSGAVASAAVRARSDIHAVTVGFDAAGYDETPLARATAEHLGIGLSVEQGTIEPFSREAFDDILLHHGQPFADTSAVPTRAVSRAARRHFKVVLSGDGGDELLAGYLSHLRQRRVERWGGGLLGGTLAGLLRRVAAGAAGEAVDRGLRLVEAAPRGFLPHVLAGVFSDEMALELVADTEWERATREHLDEARDEARRLSRTVPDTCLALSLYQLQHSLPQDILAKVDRMSMAESLEVRAPFLDSRLAAYALSLPAHVKLRGSVGKYALRRALRGRLPAAVLAAPKRGFALPVRDWLGSRFWASFRGEIQAYARTGGGEMNHGALVRRARVDEERCRLANDFRALHRSVSLYAFLRWRRLLAEAPRHRALVEPEHSFA